MTGEWFHNGEAVQTASIDDRAFQYGDGLFETVAIRHGKPRLWTLHLERLTAGCERLGLGMPDTEQLRAWLDDALLRTAHDNVFCTAKIILTAGVTRRGYGRRQAVPAMVWIGVFHSAPVAEKAYREGVDTIECTTRLATGSAMAGLKTLNRLEQVLARSECLQAGAFEGITLDAEGRVICGTMSNVFVVRKETILTPSLARCGVRGVMRSHVIETLRAAGQDVVSADLDQETFRDADEVFLTNSQFVVLPVGRCDEREWPVGNVTRRLMALLADSGMVECRL